MMMHGESEGEVVKKEVAKPARSPTNSGPLRSGWMKSLAVPKSTNFKWPDWQAQTKSGNVYK